MFTLSTNQPGAPADYSPYLYGAVHKTDKMNVPTTLGFSVVSTSANVPLLNRGTYITVYTDTYGVWFTGFIINEPSLTWLGTQQNGNTKEPVYGYMYQATSDEYLLNLNMFGLVNPYLNTTQGEIIKDLVGLLAPAGWNFNTSGVQAGQIMPRYVPDPTKKFTQVIADFCKQANYRYYVRNLNIVFEPQDSQPCGIVVDGNSQYFTPKNLQISASTESIYNDVIVLGQVEPENYMNEYFIGDGYTGKFPLITSVYGVDKTILLQDSFAGSSISNQNWNVYDAAGMWIVPNNGFLNALGGTNDGLYDSYIESANLIPLEGIMRITHGEYDFVADSDGVVASLWTASPAQSTTAPLTGCLYGIKCTKVNPSAPIGSQDGTTLNPIVNGVVDTTQSIAVNYNYRYIIRTVLTLQNTMRQLPEYSYIDQAGTVQTVGGSSLPDVATFSTIITAINPTNAALVQQWNWSNTGVALSAGENFAYYVPMVLNDLHCTLTGITISTPMQANLFVQYPNTSNFVQQLIGPNEIDSLDGLAPSATIIDSGSGSTTASSLLAIPSYNSGQAQLEFFSNSAVQSTSIPPPKSVIHLSYRRGYSAIARVQDQNSINREAAAWGDDGLRTYVQKALYLLPRSTEWCELLAQATLNDRVYQHYTGSYKMYSGPWFTSEPLSGTILKFQNLPSSINANLQAEEVNEVSSTLVHSSGREYIQHTLNYGPIVTASQIISQIQSVNGVFTPTDSVEMPYAVDVNSVGNTFVGDVTAPTLSSWDLNNYYYNINQNPPAGGGFEIRYTDQSWGIDAANNLITRTSGSTFSVPRNSQGKICFVKAYDTRNNLLWSEDMTQSVWANAGTLQVSNSLLKNRLNLLTMISTVTLAAAQGSALQQLTPITPNANLQACYSVDLLCAAGGQVVVQVIDGTGVVYGQQTVNLAQYWQRVTVPATGAGHTTFGTQLGVRIYNPGTTSLNVQINRCSLEVGTLTETVYAKTGSITFGAMSRFAAGLNVAFPLIPAPPTATITFTDPTQITINVVLPSYMTDVWGTEIRASDQTTVLYSSSLINSSYQAEFIAVNNSRTPSYWVYTFNLLGEYSTGYEVGITFEAPSISSITFNDPTATMAWVAAAPVQNLPIPGAGSVQYTEGAGAMFYEVQFSPSSTFASDVTTLTYPSSNGAGVTELSSGNSVNLGMNYFSPYYWKVTPYDQLGAGTPLSVLHTYVSPGVTEFGSNEVVLVGPSAASGQDPAIPPSVQSYQAEYLNIARAAQFRNFNIY